MALIEFIMCFEETIYVVVGIIIILVWDILTYDKRRFKNYPKD